MIKPDGAIEYTGLKGVDRLGDFTGIIDSVRQARTLDPGNPYYIDLTSIYPYNPQKSKQLLAEAGYPNGFNTKLYVEGAAYGTKALAIAY